MQQWVDLARLTGLQSSEDEGPPSPVLEERETEVEDSVEPKTPAWEQPASSAEDTEPAEVKQESRKSP